MQPKISLGADPELFLQDASGALVSAIGKIGGTKQQPKPLPIGSGFAVQEDNVALEYNIPPSASEQDFVKNINKVMRHLRKMVGRQGLSFAPMSAISFPQEELMDPASRVFGCDPDFNAWRDGARNPPPRAPDPNLRSAGGHVHVGAAFDTKESVHEFIQRCDLFLGVPSVLLDSQGSLRRELYGRPGAFRYKSFGCEYRSLSNFWIFKPELVSWVWKNTTRAYNDKVIVDQDRQSILECINFNDAALAEKLVAKYDIALS